MNKPTQFPTLTHHKLRVYWKAVDLVRWVQQNRIQDGDLRDQAERAVRSIALNIAEGSSGDGGMARRHFDIARRSTLETVAAYDLAAALGEKVAIDGVREDGAAIVAMLTGLLKRNAR